MSRRSGIPTQTIHCEDNLTCMTRLPGGSCDLIYIDPPFCSGRRRSGPDADRGFEDKWCGGRDAYLDFMRPRLAECHRLLADRGCLALHIDWRVAHHLRLQLDEIFGEANFLNEIIWHYRTGGVSKQWLGRKHDTILLYAKSIGSHTFNVIREGEFRTDGLRRDENGRPYKSTTKGRLYFNADGPALTDVWDIPFLSTVSLERVRWPTQKPVALLERLIRVCTDPGDLVADFFCGSGTTLVAAQNLEREWIGCDLSSEAVRIAYARLRQVDSPA